METNNQQTFFKPSKNASFRAYKMLTFQTTIMRLWEHHSTEQRKRKRKEKRGGGGGRSGGLKLELFPTKRHVGAKQAATCLAAKSELEKANFGGRVAKKSKGGSTQGP